MGYIGSVVNFSLWPMVTGENETVVMFMLLRISLRVFSSEFSLLWSNKKVVALNLCRLETGM